jgi:guanosine-3',5'-bis(diphosphate) 3'-pyrophosphohydrolase
VVDEHANMDRDVLQKRIARLTSLENVGAVFRDGHAIYLRAKEFAIRTHMSQIHRDKFYTCHLEQVENVLIRFDCCSFRMRAAAWLHGTVNKSGVTMNDINREFPGFIASMVDALTNAPGETREERNSATFSRIKERGGMAIILKLADRIANVEEAISSSDISLSMYKDEYSDFRDALHEPGMADAMWEHLDALDEIVRQMVNQGNITALAKSVQERNATLKQEVKDRT